MAETGQKRRALVTGASGGIGKELARLFAKDGHDVVLVARNEPALRGLADELGRDHGVAAVPLAVDLAQPDAAEAIVGELGRRGLGVDFLVNNAGFGSNGPFLELELGREREMLAVNIAALVALTHHLARPMRERGFGRVLNIASTAGFQPGPYMATYYASKAFVLSFSEALAFELRGTGVTVTCHCPGATATGFAATSGTAGSRLFRRGRVADAPSVARHAYRAMQRGKVVAVHGALNALVAQSIRVSPRAVVRWVAAALNRAG